MSLRPNERFALFDLLLKEGIMLWDEFSKRYEDDLQESIYWELASTKINHGLP